MSRGAPIDDRWFRAVCIPGFGVAIPNVVGLFGDLGPGDLGYWLGYVYFIGLAAAIWHGNRWALFAQRARWGWFDRPVRKIALLGAAVVLFTAPLTVACIAGWYLASGLPVDMAAVREVTLINVICVVFVTHVYETAFLIKEREADLVRVERLERARAEAALEALRSQVAPHFLFNSLTTLAHLIETAPARARDFNASLARVYRYILLHRDRDLVPLAEELAFVETYFSLLRLRFGEALGLSCELGDADAARWLVPPISLQTLVENAVKHNAFDDREPMAIEVRFTGAAVEVANVRRERADASPSSRLGLVNLDERCRLATRRGLEIDRARDRFAVRVPALEVGG